MPPNSEENASPPTLHDRAAWIAIGAALTAMGLDLAYLVWNRIDLLKYRPNGMWPQLLRQLPVFLMFVTIGLMFFRSRGRRLFGLGMYLCYAAITVGLLFWQWISALTQPLGNQGWVRPAIYLALVGFHCLAMALSWQLARREVSAGCAGPPAADGSGHAVAPGVAGSLRNPTFSSILTTAPQSAAWFRYARGWVMVPMVYHLGLVMAVQAYSGFQACLENGGWALRGAYLGWCLTNILLAGVMLAWLYSDRVVLQALGAGAAACEAWLLFAQLVQEYHDGGGVVSGLILRVVPSSSADQAAAVATGTLLAIWSVVAINMGTRYCLRLTALLHAGEFTSPEPVDPTAIEVTGWDEGARK